MTTSPEAVTAAQMRELDRRAVEEFGIPGIVLMENAGRGVADEAERMLSALPPGARTAVLCGGGNNAGDGFVAARHLSNRGYPVDIVLLKPAESLKGDARTNALIAGKMRLPMRPFAETRDLAGYGLIVDALLGTGVTGEVTGPFRSAIEGINRSGARVLSVDIPSGLEADTGEILGAAVRADVTVTMVLPKRGLLAPGAAALAGKLVIADIGAPPALRR